MEYELYDLAFSFKKSKLWKKLWDSQLFAVAHADGSIGYCCVMGRAGRHLALAVYPGKKGLATYRLMGSGNRENLTSFEMREMAMAQDCLMLSFQDKAELSEEEQDDLAAYCEDRGVALRGQRACPQFERFRPMHHPWSLDDEEDIPHLKEALQAAREVSRALDTGDAKALGFTDGPPYDRDIPLLKLQKNQYVWHRHPLPPPDLVEYPSIKLKDNLALARLKKVKEKAGEWSAQVFMHTQAMTQETQDGDMARRPNKAPVYPLMLMVVDNQSGMVLSLQMSPKAEDYPAAFTPSLVDLITKAGKPTAILVKDERTFALLESFCQQLNIPLEGQHSIEALDEALDDFNERFSPDDEDDDGPGLDEQMQYMIQALEGLPSLRELPGDLLTSLLDMLPAGLFSKELQDRVKAEAKRRGM